MTGKGLQKSRHLRWNVLSLNWTRFNGRICFIYSSSLYLTSVRPLFTLLYRGSDNSPLLIGFSANYIDQSNRNFHATEGSRKFFTFWSEQTTCQMWHENVTTKRLSSSSKYCTAFERCSLIDRNSDAICKYKVHTMFTWTRSVMGSYLRKRNRSLYIVRLELCNKMNFVFNGLQNGWYVG